MAEMINDPIGVSEAARIICVTPGRVRQLLRAKELTGEKLSELQWMIEKESALHYKHNRPPVGRPAEKPKTKRGR
jgi:hypothetical protein